MEAIILRLKEISVWNCLGIGDVSLEDDGLMGRYNRKRIISSVVNILAF